MSQNHCVSHSEKYGLLTTKLKGIVHLKIKILSSFSHPQIKTYMTFFCGTQKKKVATQALKYRAPRGNGPKKIWDVIKKYIIGYTFFFFLHVLTKVLCSPIHKAQISQMQSYWNIIFLTSHVFFNMYLGSILKWLLVVIHWNLDITNSV